MIYIFIFTYWWCYVTALNTLLFLKHNSSRPLWGCECPLPSHPACSSTLIPGDGNGAPCSSLALVSREEPACTSSIPVLHQRTRLQFQAPLHRGVCIFIKNIMLESHLWSEGLCKKHMDRPDQEQKPNTPCSEAKGWVWSWILISSQKDNTLACF